MNQEYMSFLHLSSNIVIFLHRSPRGRLGLLIHSLGSVLFS